MEFPTFRASGILKPDMSKTFLRNIVALVALTSFFGAGCALGPQTTSRPTQLAPAPAPTAAPTIPPEASNVPKPY